MYLAVNTVPYCGKLSRKKTFANFVDLGRFVKVFSTKRPGVPWWFYSACMHVLYYTAHSSIVGVSHPIFHLRWIHKSFLHEIIDSWKFSPSKISLHTVSQCNCVCEDSHTLHACWIHYLAVCSYQNRGMLNAESCFGFIDAYTRLVNPAKPVLLACTVRGPAVRCVHNRLLLSE